MTLRHFPIFTAAALAGCLGAASIAQADPLPAALVNAASILENYNVVTFGNFGSSTSPYGNADAQGPMAIGGSAYLNSFNVSPQLPNAPYAMVTGGDLDLANLPFSGAFGGAQISGNAFVGGNAILGVTQGGGATITGNLTVNGNFTGNHGSVTGTVFSSGATTINSTSFSVGASVSQPPTLSPVNFGTLATQLNAASQALAALPDTVGTSVSGQTMNGVLTLSGTNTSLNVFSVTANEILNDSFDINIPIGSLAVINLDGTATFANSGFECDGGACSDAQSSDLLFNVTNTSDLTMYNIGLPGSLLAPGAAFFGSNGRIEGSIIADSIMTPDSYNTGGFEFEWDPSSVPDSVPEPTSVPLFGAGLLALAMVRRVRREL